jgi:Glycosyltransferase sugar-binding region containing DXD motif
VRRETGGGHDRTQRLLENRLMPLIHQIMLGDKVPRFNQECLNSWGQLTARRFDIVSWTDLKVKEYLRNCQIASAKRLYERARNHGEASDILRMAITYSFGGLYVDWDVLLMDPDNFLAVVGEVSRSDCVLIRDGHTTEPRFSRVYDNSLFYMSKGNSLALDFLGEIERNYSKRPLPSTSYLTGPLALTSFLDAHPHYENACRAIEMHDIYAFDYEEVIGQTKDATSREILKQHWDAGRAPAIHFWTHSWFPMRSWPRRLLDRVFRTVGRTMRSSA